MINKQESIQVDDETCHTIIVNLIGWISQLEFKFVFRYLGTVYIDCTVLFCYFWQNTMIML